MNHIIVSKDGFCVIDKNKTTFYDKELKPVESYKGCKIDELKLKIINGGV